MTPPGASATSGDATGSGSRRRTSWLFALATALHGLVFLLALPPWMGEDEPWHLEYASHVAAGYRPWGGQELKRPGSDQQDPRVAMSSSQLQVLRRFHAIPAERVSSTQRAILASMAQRGFYQRVDWAGIEPERSTFDQITADFTATKNPPLYYLLAGGWIRLWGADSVEGQLRAGRLLSWLLYVATALAALAFARTVFDDERAALCTAALVAFLPMSARQAAVVSNDVLAKLCATLVLWLAARRMRGQARSWELGLAIVLCVLGMLSKPTATGSVAALILALFMASRHVEVRLRPLHAALLVLVMAGATALVRVFQHDPTVPRTVGRFLARIEQSLDLAVWTKFGRTLAGSFGWESRYLPGAVNVVLGLLSLCGLALCCWRGSRAALRPVLTWCGAVVAVQLLLIGLHGVALGRYLIPALPALAVLLVAGMVSSWPERLRSRAAGLFLGALLAYDALFLWGGLLLHEALLLSI